MKEELNINFVDSNGEIILSRTKKDDEKISRVYRNMSDLVRKLFVKEFGFKIVGNEYLELQINNHLLELRITNLMDSVYLSFGIWENRQLTNIYRGSSVTKVYYIVKVLIKTNGDNLMI